MKNQSKSSSTPRRQPGGQAGNQNARKHGAYAQHFVTDKEREIFNDLRTQLAKDFKKESGADTLELDMVCLMALRHGAALEKGEIDIAVKLDAAVRNHLVALKANRASRKKEQEDKPQTTSAEWMANLVEKVRQEKEEKEKKRHDGS